MKRLFPILLALALSGAAAAHDLGIEYVAIPGSAQADYAARRLTTALLAPGVTRPPHTRIELMLDARLGAEAFTVRAHGGTVRIAGGDNRGLIYGALEAREQLLNGVPVEKLAARARTPRLPFRGIKFNTPWDSYRPSSALMQHYDTVRDLKYWEAFLDMMVENRFNAISLWSLHPFTYMVRPKNFPEASKWSDAEFAAWQHLYREIFRMAKERGLDTYIVFWSIFVSEEFAKAHAIAQENFYPHYFGAGDTSDITKRYLRESVTQVLEEYPDLDGIGVSHGEGMGGMTPLERQQFVDEVYLAGALAAKRQQPVKLIHRVPFSAGLGSGPGASREVEAITRAGMEKLGHQFDGPIWVEMKFNWSHGHSAPELVKVHGGKLGDTYFKPLPENYRIVWQVRNEDFFALRWGDGEFIRDHIARNAKPDYVGGYFVGSETYIPALDYFTASSAPVDWKWAFQRQWLFYKLWGRLLYDPKTPDRVFAAEFTRRYGGGASGLFHAYELVSETPLQLARMYDFTWDFTLYAEGHLALQGDVTKYIGVDALIAHPTLLPNYLSVKDYVTKRLAKEPLASNQETPERVAGRLEARCHAALDSVAALDTSTNVSLEYEVADIRTWAHLGLHFAEQLRGAVALATFRRGGDAAQQTQAIAHLEAALAQWDEVIRITRPLYKDMPLTHLNGSAFTANPDNLFHWARIRPDVAADVEIARQARAPR